MTDSVGASLPGAAPLATLLLRSPWFGLLKEDDTASPTQRRMDERHNAERRVEAGQFAEWLLAHGISVGAALEAGPSPCQHVNAIEHALNELGVPQPGYPQPVANAVEILRASLGWGVRGESLPNAASIRALTGEQVQRIRAAWDEAWKQPSNGYEEADAAFRERLIFELGVGGEEPRD